MNKNKANFVPLTPVSFLRRAAIVHPEKTAVIYGTDTYSYHDFQERCCRLASALCKRGVVAGDTVSILAPNIPAMLEAHFGVLMLGAILNPINYRLDSMAIRFILEHSQSKVVLFDLEFSRTVKHVLNDLETSVLVVSIEDENAANACSDDFENTAVDYEELLQEGDAHFDSQEPIDEWDSACLLYTSGTTGDPKGVLYHHRGAYLNALSNMANMGFDRNCVYLWTLPMFHCNGWTHTWAVTAACGTHVCLRKMDPSIIYPMIKKDRVTHMCGAPIVLNMLLNTTDNEIVSFDQTVKFATGGASPPRAVIEGMARHGFEISHLYGLTESFGPSLSCDWQNEWDDLDVEARSAKMARQGVQTLTLDNVKVADSNTLEEVPWDAQTSGEIMLRGNTLMKGYFKNPAATQNAFHGGWFHTGDLAVRHPDGYIEVSGRSKDIIISGGENIASLEIEEILFRHPCVLEAAVVAMPDEKWGETPCAFVKLKENCEVNANELIVFCKNNLAGFKVPRTIIFSTLPKTATGKIQKFILRDRVKCFQ